MLDWLHNTFWANWTRRALTALLASALVALTVVGVSWITGTLGRCAEGVEKIEGECIGVNGSGYDFGTAEIRQVSRAIAEENERAAEQDHVTVAVMLPLQPERAAERKQLRSELQGAYLGQYRANREEERPLLRLVLANPGDGYKQHKRVVDRLGEMADSKQDKLRAVTGFNLSLGETESAMRRLTNDLGIPVLAARVSADQLANPEKETAEPLFKGLARIIPTNRQQADALASFHGGLKDRETVLVKDTRPDDIYVESLAEAFSRKEEGPPGPKVQRFESPADMSDAGDTGNHFSLIANNICRSDTKVVYFAGRPVHLRLFALKLAEVPCDRKQYTVVSGSGAATLDRYMSGADWEKLRGGDPQHSKVTVEYVAPAHPSAWELALTDWEKDYKKRTGRTPEAKDKPAYLVEPQKELRGLERLARQQKTRIGRVSLEDSRTILVYDGIRTIAKAVFLAKSSAAGSVPPREHVSEQWQRLDTSYRVIGASGWICLTNGGNPYDKPVAVVQLDPRNRELKFVGLGWPENKPQPDDCVVPSGTD